MNHQALLFCADEKTVRAVTQVFRELDFSVEVNNEPFDAVKRLMAQHFDAIIVDCESEQNATLLFKSARNSALNNGSLAVAVVEGQANIAKAFRLGGNLVLTKPINLEQAKGTLRVARGLLRKAEANKLAASITNSSSQPVVEASEPKTMAAAASQKSVLTPVPAQTSQASSPTSVVEKESQAKLDTPQAAASTAKADEPKVVAADKKPGSGLSFGTGAAPAPAKDSQWTKPVQTLEPKAVPAGAAKQAPEKPAEKPDAPSAKATNAKPVPASSRFATLGVKQDEPIDAAQSHKNFWIAAVLVLGLAASGYFGWRKYHDVIKLPFSQTSTAVIVPPPPPVAKPPAQIAPPTAVASDTTTTAPEAATAVTPTAGEKKPAAVETNPAPHESAGIVRLSETASQGLLVKRLDPSYPDQAKEQKLEGAVHLQARINKAGDVTQVATISGNPVLAQAATAAVKQWKYKPYLVNGTPVEVLTPITVDLKP
jgi:TonB family protein